MPTQCSADLFGFAPVDGRRVEAGFDGGTMTSDAGALLLGATDRVVGLVGRLAGCFVDARRPDLIEHDVATLIGQRVFGIALGYEDLNDHEHLRHDARRFKDLRWSTRESWSRRRRVIAKAEWTKGEANPRFIVTSLKPGEVTGRHLYEEVYCARGDMENRIKETQGDLFADRTSAATMRANQLRLWFASMAYVLMCALRRIGLPHTQFAEAACGTIRLKLLKLGALVRVSVRRVKFAMASGCPWQNEWALAHARLRNAAAA